MDMKEIIENFHQKKVLVVGDITLDKYVHGKATGLSAEAPVPEILVENEEFKFGGAANLANNIVHMGGKVLLCGIVGNDDSGKFILEEMKRNGLDLDGVFILNDRPTTTTTRIIVEKHHIARIHKESREEIDDSLSEKIFNFVKSNIKSSDVLIFSDHNKGMLTQKLIESLIGIGKENGKIVIADPSYTRFFNYINVDVFKPVDREASAMTGIKIINESSLRNICIKLLNQLNCNHVLLTSAKYGTISLDKSGEFSQIKPEEKDFFDSTGEGDASTAAFSLAIATSGSIKDAMRISNIATELKLRRIGTAVITKEELFSKINSLG